MAIVKLQAFLQENKDHIIDVFADRVIERYKQNIPKKEIRNRLDEYLDDIIGALSAEAEGTDPTKFIDHISDSCRAHALQRWGLKIYSVQQIAEEYHMLFDIILEVWNETTGEKLDSQVAHFNKLIHKGIAEAVSEFAARDAERVEDARRKAEQAAREREEMVAIVSHDLKNPLGVILMNTTSMMEDLNQNEIDKHKLLKKVEFNRRAAQRMHNLIVQILDLAELKAGKYNLNLTSVKKIELLKDSKEYNYQQAETRHIHMQIIDETEGASVLCDRHKLMQVFNNILSNAIKYSHEGGEITLRSRHVDGLCRFEIEDHGVGIPLEQIPLVFDRFWKSPKADYRSSGLGLSIASGIVNAHGGRLWVESKEGSGATFIFTLPSDASKEQDSSKPKSP